MKKRHPNHRLVKIHRNYAVEEIAKLFGIHKNTVRTWVKNGLSAIDEKRPMLILGHELVEFLKARGTGFIKLNQKKINLSGIGYHDFDETNITPLFFPIKTLFWGRILEDDDAI